MSMKPKTSNAKELQRQVKELRNEVERLQQTVDNLLMLVIEKELEDGDYEEGDLPLGNEVALWKNTIQRLN